ncbi:ficolin-1-like [Haliotis cracherodii]|uniref:ficolin-1-like n=1 Tax=Haliotis cracherodii TaxID=6455 RepID=UPI0039EB641B
MRKYTWYPYVDFNRTWDEYRDGFGDLNFHGNFWLGNEKLFLVTTHRNMKFNIQMTTLGTFKQHFYGTFQVSNESSGYQVSFQSNYPNTLEDGLHYLNNCMEYQRDMLFTTIDRDNDLNSGGNCAQIHLSGWWYNDCGGCNPTGKLQPKSETHQSSDPTYMSVPVPGDWAADTMQLILENM